MRRIILMLCAVVLGACAGFGQDNITRKKKQTTVQTQSAGKKKSEGSAGKGKQKVNDERQQEARLTPPEMVDRGDAAKATSDYAEAVKWYRKAADEGNARGQDKMGDMYYYGRGVSKDDSEAVRWYRKAATQGYSNAQCNLGWMCEKGSGVSQDYSEALKWYRKAAEQGHRTAQYNLGVMYKNGRGVPQDLSEARRWYEKAAAQGDEDAKKALKNL